MNRFHSRLVIAFAVLGVAFFAFKAGAWQDPSQSRPKVGFSDTPRLPDSKWRVHDSERPLPRVVTPGALVTQGPTALPPSDAIVLFDGKDLSHWKGEGGKPAGWKVEDGAMVVVPKSGTIYSVEEFGDCQLHLEWAEPTPPRGSDQGRGNSGVMFFGRYEMQVLDCFDNPTYADGTTGAVYGQMPPLVNACRKPGEWQSYDIAFTAPRFKSDGSLESPAYVTTFVNGVLVQNHTKIIGSVAWRAVGTYSPHGPKGPLSLQDHGNPVRFRNIWVRELKPEDRN
jgi:hypothetical protein